MLKRFPLLSIASILIYIIIIISTNLLYIDVLYFDYVTILFCLVPVFCIVSFITSKKHYALSIVISAVSIVLYVLYEFVEFFFLAVTSNSFPTGHVESCYMPLYVNCNSIVLLHFGVILCFSYALINGYKNIDACKYRKTRCFWFALISMIFTALYVVVSVLNNIDIINKRSMVRFPDGSMDNSIPILGSLIIRIIISLLIIALDVSVILGKNIKNRNIFIMVFAAYPLLDYFVNQLSKHLVSFRYIHYLGVEKQRQIMFGPLHYIGLAFSIAAIIGYSYKNKPEIIE